MLPPDGQSDDVQQLARNPFQRPWMITTGAASTQYEQSHLLLKAALTGGITGAIDLLLAYPLEYIKTQLQFEQTSKLEKLVHHTNILDMAKYTYKKSGYIGFYKGMGVMLVGNVPKAAVRFATFETYRNNFGDDNHKLSTGGKIAGGLLAGTLESIVVVTPMETIKVKAIHDLNRDKSKYKGSFHTIVSILKEEGVRNTYHGLVPTILKQSTNQGTRFLMMESFKEYYEKQNGRSVPVYVNLPWSFVTSVVTSYLNAPIDVVKTRMQGLERRRYKNTLDCIKLVFVEEGFKGFYKGSFTRSLRMCVDTAVSFTLYDHVMKHLSKILP